MTTASKWDYLLGWIWGLKSLIFFNVNLYSIHIYKPQTTHAQITDCKYYINLLQSVVLHDIITLQRPILL